MIRLFITLLFFSLQLVNGQIVRKYSNEFLNIGTGARAIGMGGAVISNQNDVYAAMWNPAGLSGVEKDWQGALMHAEYFQSIAKYDYVSFAKALDNSNGAVSLSIIRLGIDDILNTTQMIDSQGNIDYNKITKFSQADYAALLSFGFNPNKKKNISLGANAKLVYRNVGKFATAFGFGFDLGGVFVSDKGWRFGAVLKDITTTVNFWTINNAELSIIVNGQQFNPVPTDKIELTMPKFNAGVSRNFEINRDLEILPEVGLNVDFTKTAALLSSNILSVSPYFGSELSFQKMIFLRVGINRFQSVMDLEYQKRKISFQPSAGVGIKYKGLTLDYAISNSGINGSNFYSNFFSLKFDMKDFRN